MWFTLFLHKIHNAVRFYNDVYVLLSKKTII